MISKDRVEKIGLLEEQLVGAVNDPWEIETIEYRHDADDPDTIQARLLLRCEKPPAKNTIL